MVRKIQAKLVLRLHAQGLSGRAIARCKACRAGAFPMCSMRRGPSASAGMMSPARPTARCTPCCFPVGVSAKACTSSPTGPGFIASWRAWA